VSEKFKVYAGKFPCKKCNEEVTSLRLWIDSADLTWMCSNKHLSKVPLILTKKDYERESGK
jgi:hypothetical protein